MTPFRWRIELFGSLCLRREDQVVETFPPSKVGGLLAYLACQPERTHARQELAAFFWPEADNGTGRTRLRQHLTALRRHLEPKDIPPESVLRANRDEIVLEPSAFTTDVADFEDTLRLAEQTSDPDERLALLDCAIGFYRSEFLFGYYEHWILGERERLKERAGDALRALASACEEAQDTARSIGYLQRLVAVEPLREENHFALMRLLIATHQPAAARRQYKTLERLLKTGLDAVPSVATRALLVGLPSEVSGTQNVSVSEGTEILEGAASSASTPRVLADAIPSVPIEGSLPAIVAQASTLEVPAAQPAPPIQETQSSSPVSAVPIPVLAKRVRYRSLLFVSLLALLLTIVIGRRLFSLPDNNPAHKNFSPAALKNGKQDELWVRCYEPKPGDKDSQPTSMVVDKTGNIYVVGFIDTVKTDVDFLTLKYAPDGTLLWEQRYNGTGNDMDRAGTIAVDADGNVYVTGESIGKSGSGPDEHNEADIVTLKYDSNGNKVGEDRFNGLGNGNDGPSKIALDGKGHVYVFGTTWDGKLENGRDGHGFVLIQYDRNLRTNWICRYHDPNGGPARSADMVIDPEGYVYVTGTCGNGFVTLKYDANGVVLKKDIRRVEKEDRSAPSHILLDGADSFYIVSQVTNYTHRPGEERYAVQVLKYNRNLVCQWDHTFWKVAQNFRGAGAVVAGRVYITGMAYESGKPWVQGLLVIREDGSVGGFKAFAGASHANQSGYGLAIDHRALVHVTGGGHFADTESVSAPLDSTEITTTTYGGFSSLLRVHRYAGSELLHSLGGLAVAVDDQDNVLVAGQTYDGKHNDLVLLKYPP